MAQRMNPHQNNSFVNLTRLPLLYKKSGAMLPVLVDSMTGRQSDIDLKNSLDYLQLSLQEIQAIVGFYYPNTNFPK